MQNRSILILFVIGMAVTLIGAFFKIMEWPYASLPLIIGMTFEAAAGIFLVAKMLKKNNNSDGFLDS